MITSKAFNSLAQRAHLLFGSSITWGTILFFGPHYLWYVLPAYTLLTGLKEFLYDQYCESREVRGSNLEDWLNYQAGAYLALGIYGLKFYAVL